MFVVTGFFCLSRFYSWLTVVHFVKEIDVAVPLLAVQSAALLDVDGDDSHGGEADHDYEAHEFAEEDGGQQEAKEAQADGSGGIGQEPAADAHELQWLLESLEDRDAIEIDVHYLVVLLRYYFTLYIVFDRDFRVKRCPTPMIRKVGLLV
jgi:hypothetical protein